MIWGRIAATPPGGTAIDPAAPTAMFHSGLRRWNCSCEIPVRTGTKDLPVSWARTTSAVIWLEPSAA